MALTLLLAGTAHADITGSVTTLGGAPLGGASVAVLDAAAAQIATTPADPTGRYTFTTAALAGKTAPFTVRAVYGDPCRSAPELPTRSAQATGLADGATQNLALDVTELCGDAAPPGLPAPTAFIDSPTRRVLAGPGATAYLRTPIPAEATSVEVRLSTGAVVSQAPPSAGLVPIVGPTLPYSGPLTLAYSLGGTAVTRQIGEMTSGIVAKPAPGGPLDVVVAAPLSGVAFRGTGTSDAGDWISLLGWLSRAGDALGAFGYDSFARPVADITPVRGKDSVTLIEDISLATLVGTSGVNDSNVAFRQTLRLLTAPGLDLNRRKLVVFVATAASSPTTYLNEHLRLAFNGTARPWPVCAIQVGVGISITQRVSMRRIALDTGGVYLEAASARDVADRILQCRAAATGDTTLLERVMYLARRPRAVTFTAPARRSLTIVLSAGSVTKAGVSVIDPSGRTRTSTKPGPGVTFIQRDTYTLVKVARAARGAWSIRLSAGTRGGAALRVLGARPGSAF